MEKPKLKILQLICSTGFYGAERWILAMAKNFDPKLIQCDLAITLEDNSKDLELVKHYSSECAHIGEVFEIPMSNRFDIKVITRLVRHVKENQIDIIHSHGYKSDILGVIAAKLAGIKSVITPHGFENATDWKLRLFIWLGCKAMKFADNVVPLSKQIQKDVATHKVNQNYVTYIQNGVDLSEVEATRTNLAIKKLDNNKKIIGFIGQMISRKNIIDILDIFDTLSNKHDNLELQLLGDGEVRKALEAHTSLLKNRDKIKFLGFQDERLSYLKQFDLFVMTSSLEGIPRCLMEAMAMGIPVAAYDISGIDQLITNKKTGLLAKFGDKKTLEQHWEKLLTDQALSTELSKNARTFVQDHYSAKRMAREYHELFSQLMA
jgi:glycosyltransferase involved in cell wall biosynthesis